MPDLPRIGRLTYGDDKHEVHAHEHVGEGVLECETCTLPDGDLGFGLVHTTGREDQSVLSHLALFIGEPARVVG